MRDLCSHMSTVAMVTVRAGVDPKGWGEEGGGSFSPHNPPSKAKKKEMAGEAPHFYPSSSSPSWEKEVEHDISTNESSLWGFIEREPLPSLAAVVRVRGAGWGASRGTGLQA